MLHDRIAVYGAAFPDIVDHAAWHFENALNQHEPSVRDVEIRLSDVNGPKGAGARCFVLVRLLPAGQVLITQEADNDKAAIAAAAERAKQSVGRLINKRKPSRGN